MAIDSIELLALISVLAFVSGVVSACFGFGAGLILTPMLAFIFPIKEAIAISSLIYFFTSISKAVLYHRELNWHHFSQAAPAALLGMFIGFFSITYISGRGIEVLCGLVLMYFSIQILVFSRSSYTILPACLYPALAGASSALLHAGGPFFFRYCLLHKLSPVTTVATMAGLQLMLNSSKALFFVSGGYVATAYIYYLIPVYIVAIAGVWLGKFALKNRINEKGFRIGAGIIMLILGLRLLF